MSVSYQKVKSVGKDVKARGPALEKTILRTMGMIANVVGGTLGPGGQPVLIERQEHDMPPIVTKDGVTVFRNLGFDDSTSQVILEAARDAAIRTANEAGDGTTTATILAEAIVRLTHLYCRENPRVSPQRVTRRLMDVFRTNIEPIIKSLAIKADLSTESGSALLKSVAKISANGDNALADAVMDCFNLVGDGGNVTITEVSGPSTYEVERIEGYPITGMGYEDSCGKYASKFINDPAGQRILLEKPIFVIYHGKLTEIQTLTMLMEKIGAAWQDPSREETFRHNVILVATGFSEGVVAQLAFNFVEQTSINVVPLLAPISPVPGGQLGLLEDLCAVTGSKLFDPLSSPLDQAELSELGTCAKAFEMSRFRTTIFSEEGDKMATDAETGAEILGDPPNMLNVLERVQMLEKQAEQSAGDLDKSYINERIGKLTGGIARLKVVGSSSGEMRERRDRAEDAICAVRGAINHGCLPGGGWTLMRVANDLMKLEDQVVSQVLCKALMAPVQKLFSNAGFGNSEAQTIVETVATAIVNSAPPVVYDALDSKFVSPIEGGILDSLPAVLEALRNSLSIASLLGTLGGTIVYKRDHEHDRSEARENASWLRDSEEFEVDERGM